MPLPGAPAKVTVYTGVECQHSGSYCVYHLDAIHLLRYWYLSPSLLRAHHLLTRAAYIAGLRLTKAQRGNKHHLQLSRFLVLRGLEPMYIDKQPSATILVKPDRTVDNRLMHPPTDTKYYQVEQCHMFIQGHRPRPFDELVVHYARIWRHIVRTISTK